MSNQHNAVELLKSFVEAGNALEELPKVKRDLEDANELAKLLADDLTREQDRTRNLAARIAELEAKLSGKEEELSTATFRNSSLQAVVDLIRGALPVQPVSASDVQPVEEAPQSPLTQSTSETSIGADSIPETGLDSTSRPSPEPSASGEYLGLTASSAQPTETESPAPSPTASTSTPEPGIGVESAANESSTLAEDREYKTLAEEAKAPELRSYWLKPRDMSWRFWRDQQNGSVPAWVTNLDAA